MPRDSPRFGSFRLANFSSPACTFKISRYAANYRYLIASEINAQGWKKRLGLEGAGWGGGGGGILKISSKGGGGKIFICNFFLLGGGVKLCYTTLF